MKKKKILLFNKPWNEGADDGYNFQINESFELTTNATYIEDAAAIIFHMPSILSPDSIMNAVSKRKDQLWVFWSMECSEHYKWQYEPRFLELFDIKATYRFDSDIPVPYLFGNFKTDFLKPPRKKSKFVNAFISSDFNLSLRNEYLAELMSYINVDSFGKVLNNKSLKNDKGITTKLSVIAKYKFSIAFENAIGTDYVTEKFFEPLLSGSVPVYLGAPNVNEFAPGDRSFINVKDFSSMHELAKYLVEVNSCDSLYQSFFDWKHQPIKDDLLSKLDIIERHPLIRLCEFIDSHR